MSTSSGRATSQRASGERGNRAGELSLLNWPLRDGGLSVWAAFGCVILTAVGVGFVSQSVAGGAVSFAALMASMWRMWIPVGFELGPRGVTEIVLGRRRQIAWRNVARYEVRRYGVLLHSEAATTPLAVLRATYVRWGKHRDELLEIVAHYMNGKDQDHT